MKCLTHSCDSILRDYISLFIIGYSKIKVETQKFKTDTQNFEEKIKNRLENAEVDDVDDVDTQNG